MGAEGGYCSFKLKEPIQTSRNELNKLFFDSFKFEDYCNNVERPFGLDRIFCDWKDGFGELSTLEELPKIINSIRESDKELQNTKLIELVIKLEKAEYRIYNERVGWLDFGEPYALMHCLAVNYYDYNYYSYQERGLTMLIPNNSKITKDEQLLELTAIEWADKICSFLFLDTLSQIETWT